MAATATVALHVRRAHLHAVARVLFVIVFSSLATAFTLSPLTFFFVPFGMLGYVADGDVFHVLPFGVQSGLREGDRIAPETPFFDRLWIASGVPYHRVGEHKTVGILRNGVRHTVTLHVDPRGSLFQASTLSHNIGWSLRIVTVLMFVGVGTFLVLACPRPLTWALYFFLIGPSIPKIVYEILLDLPMPLGFILNLIRSTLAVVGLYGFTVFALWFPKDHALGWRLAVQRAFLAFAIPALFFNAYEWFVQGSPGNSSNLQVASTAFGASWAPVLEASNLIFGGESFPLVGNGIMLCAPLLIAVLSLLGKYRAAPLHERQRLTWVIAGVLLAYTPIFLQFVMGWLLGDTYPMAIGTAIRVSAIGAPFALGYAILKHRVIDVRFVISRTLLIASVAAVMVAAFLGIDALFSAFLVDSRLQIALDFVLVAGTAIGLTRAHSRLVALLDRIFFPVRSERLQRLLALRERAEEERDVDKVEEILNARACEALGLTSSALFLPCPDGGFVRNASVGWTHGTTWHALRDDPIVAKVVKRTAAVLQLDDDAWPEAIVPQGDARPSLVIALRFRRNICALQFYGSHVGGSDLDPAEVSGLQELCARAAPAIGSCSSM